MKTKYEHVEFEQVHDEYKTWLAKRTFNQIGFGYIRYYYSVKKHVLEIDGKEILELKHLMNIVDFINQLKEN